MNDESIVSFFEALSDDDVEKRIIRLISQDFSDKEIVEQLLGLGKEEV